jgi:hypothetical protein
MTTLLKLLNNPYIIGVLLIAGIISDLILWGLSCDLGKSDWAAWVQAVGSVVAIIAAFLVADRQFRMSRRETRAMLNEQVIRRITLLNHVFFSLILETNHIEAAFHYSDAVVSFDPVRIRELRDAIKQIPVMDAPTAELAVVIPAIPAAVDSMLDALEKHHSSVGMATSAPASLEIQEQWRETLRHCAKSLRGICQRSMDRGEKEIERLKTLL